MKKEENYAQILLKDEAVQKLLKQMILEKANRYDKVSKIILSDEENEKLMASKITPESLHNLLDSEIAKDESRLIKRDLSSMCYQLNKNDGKIAQTTKWDTAYHYATNIANIVDVVSSLTGESNLNKNIPCPFHEDKTPSLKVYAKSNRFVCFGCNARGSPIDFVIKYKNCSFKEAVQFLSNL